MADDFDAVIDKAVTGFAAAVLAGDLERAERFATLAILVDEERRESEVSS
jgi:hypothetical protein